MPRKDAFSGAIEAARAQGTLVEGGMSALRATETAPPMERRPSLPAQTPTLVEESGASGIGDRLKALKTRARTETIVAYGVEVPVPPSDQDVMIQVSARIPKAMRMAIGARCDQLGITFGEWVKISFEAMLTECQRVFDEGDEVE